MTVALPHLGTHNTIPPKMLGTLATQVVFLAPTIAHKPTTQCASSSALTHLGTHNTIPRMMVGTLVTQVVICIALIIANKPTTLVCI